MSAEIAVSVFIGAAAVLEDLTRRQISNWIPCVALVSGFMIQTILHGLRGFLSAGAGTLVGFAVFLLFYLLGGMGGADIKLMAGFGALIGAGRVAEAALWAAACGGVLAVLWMAGASVRKFWASRYQRVQERSQADAHVASIPYAPAIAAGVWLSLIPKT